MKSQTATEYLIILAVVIVIALIVVGVLGGIPGIGAGTSERQKKLQELSNEIGISSYAVYDCGTKLTLRNNNPFTVQITGAIVNNSACSTNDLPASLTVGESISITCNGICSNLGSRYSYLVNISWKQVSSGGGTSFTQSGGVIQGVVGINTTGGSDSVTTDSTPEFTNVGFYSQSSSVWEIWRAGNYIYIGNHEDGLNIYSFDEPTFTAVKSTADADVVNSIVSNGNYIFAGFGHSIRTYTFDGTNLINIANTSDGFGAVEIWNSGNTVYAVGGYGTSNTDEGLRVYTFDGSSWTKIANANAGYNPNEVFSDNNYIYTADTAATNSLRAYTLSGSSLNLIASMDQSGIEDIYVNENYIYVAEGNNGLWAYTFDGATFTSIGHVNDGGTARNIFVNGDYIFLTSADEGINAYTFNGSTFTNIGHIDDGGIAQDITSDGTYLYVAFWQEGLRAYTFS